MEENDLNSTSAEVLRLANGCTGVKRTSGQHPGGVMVIPNYKDVYDITPIQYPANDTSCGVITTHFDYHSISGRILKLDILGHDVPTIIRMIEDITGTVATEVPLDDKETMSLFTSTEALGVTPEEINCPVGCLAIPEFGTKFVRQMLLDTKPKTFDELVRISGLSHGTDVWLNNAQDLVVLEVAYEMYARNIKILPVDIYESDATLFKVIDDKTILPPMIALQGVGENAAIHIQQERENGEFISKEDLRKRTKISKTVIETLTNHGSLKNMSDKNQLSLF